jgi:SnoaL-like domain
MSSTAPRIRILLCLGIGVLGGCARPAPPPPPAPAAQRIADRAAIEDLLAQVNLGFEFNDANQFADGFARDAVYELVGQGPVPGFQRMRYDGHDQIREIITDRIEKARAADPKTLTYDPATLRRYNRNSDSRIQIADATHARHWSTWMVVMKTNVDIHISAIGRYEDVLEKQDGKWLIKSRKRTE